MIPKCMGLPPIDEPTHPLQDFFALSSRLLDFSVHPIAGKHASDYCRRYYNIPQNPVLIVRALAFYL